MRGKKEMKHGENLRKQLLEEIIQLGILKEAKCMECGRDCEDGVEACPGCGTRMGSEKKDDAEEKIGERESKKEKHEEITRKRAQEKESTGYLS